MLQINLQLQRAIRSANLKSLSMPVIAGDHGAYAMLLAPLVVGLAVGTLHRDAQTAFPGLACLLLVLALLGCFFAREPLEMLARPGVNPVTSLRAAFWFGIYLAIAAAAGLSLLLVWQYWGLAWLAVLAILPMLAALVAVRLRRPRSLGVRLTGIAGLALSAPAAYYLLSGRLDSLAFGLWAVNWLYFAATLIYVRMWFEAKKLQKALKPGQHPLPSWLYLAAAVYTIVAAGAIAAMIATGLFPLAIVIAFLPVALRLYLTAWRPPVGIPIKRLGLLEFFQTVLFMLLLIAVLR